jgi:hypothetical protein
VRIKADTVRMTPSFLDTRAVRADAMQFTDKTLLALSDPAAAATLFSDQALQGVIAASYGIPAASLTGSPVGRFDRLDFAPFAGQAATEIEAEHHAIHRGDPAGPLASGLNARVDVLWTGSISVSASFPRAAIGVDRVAAPDLSDIDAAIQPPLPADPSALEAARRAVVIARLKAVAQDPATVTDASLDAWLDRAGLASISDFIASAAAATIPLRQFVLSFTPLPGSAAPVPMRFPVAAAGLIRDVAAADFRLADLLHASRAARARLDIEGLAPKPGGEGIPQGRAVVMWLVDAAWFDDADWPGGTSGNAVARRAARITKATDWLAAQEIALVPVTG